MKVTKAQLKKIIMEEYQKLQEGDDISRMIGDVEMVGDLIQQAIQMSSNPEVIERLERADQIISNVFEKMHDILPSMRE